MPFNLGHAQKALSIAIKHVWCHGLFNAPSTYAPDSAPIDRQILVIAKQSMPSRALGAIPAWSQINTMNSYRAQWNNLQQAAGGMSVAEWELLAFQVGGPARLVSETPSSKHIQSAKDKFLRCNKRAANPGASPTTIAKFAMDDAVRSTFMRSTWPWHPTASQMSSSQLKDKQACEALLGSQVWQVATRYASKPSSLTRSSFELEMELLQKRILTNYSNIL